MSSTSSAASHWLGYPDGPTPPAQALDQIDAWLASPSVALLAETNDHWPGLRELLERSKIVGPMVHDARIAALCRTHGVRELWSADRDSTRFGGLRVVSPLDVIGSLSPFDSHTPRSANGTTATPFGRR